MIVWNLAQNGQEQAAPDGVGGLIKLAVTRKTTKGSLAHVDCAFCDCDRSFDLPERSGDHDAAGGETPFPRLARLDIAK
jgi:hypothetical protein